MKELLKQKLMKLTKQGIITKVEKPIPWISNMVAILKPPIMYRSQGIAIK